MNSKTARFTLKLYAITLYNNIWYHEVKSHVASNFLNKMRQNSSIQSHHYRKIIIQSLKISSNQMDQIISLQLVGFLSEKAGFGKKVN